MLEELRIQNFAIIDSLELTFTAGLNVITGETGAGKSIIIDAVELLLGNKADSAFIRTGAERAIIEGVRIHADERGSGLGSRLIEWAIDSSRAQGCQLVQLTSDATRTEAHRFYARLGFEATHVGFKLPL